MGSADSKSTDSKHSASISHRRGSDSYRERYSSGESSSGSSKKVAYPKSKPESVKQKPVLTEEMERKIIYGSFKKKETREEKLIAVKREIEARFKEEEIRRKKEREEKR